MADTKEKVAPPEGALRLNIETFAGMRGKRLTEVSEKAKARNAAGESEIRYILANPYSKEANKLKDGNFHVFFGAADGEGAPYLRWYGDWFDRRSFWLGGDWHSGYRAVLRD